MNVADPDQTWSEWLADNYTKDEADKLTALREYIFDAAEHWVSKGEITFEWANKKLAKLGITDRIERETVYDLSAPVTAEVSVRVYARNRAEALEKAQQRLNGMGAASVAKVTQNGDIRIDAGAEDHDPSVIDPDAPQTVSATLTMLREIIMLGHIAGPKYCAPGASRILGGFGLAEIPETKQFVVTRPVTATAETVVEAYDAASAERVADWRWDDGRSGYDIKDAVSTDDAVVKDSVSS